MKQFRLLFMALLALTSLVLYSCGEGEDKTATDEASGDTTAATTVAPEPAVAAAPGTFIIVKHKVKDYSKWKPAYDDHDSFRLANGVHSFLIGRGVQDANMIMVATKADDLEKAKAFGKSEDLKKAMEKSGVTGKPNIGIYTVPFLRTAASSDLRVMSTFKVKDWDAWKTAFEAGKQLRLDNGLEDRGYGHDVDDNHNVMVVVSVLDSAKAVAYYKSDTLKERLQASGVTTKPDRFWYRVAQTY
jgi:hypothetical protein